MNPPTGPVLDQGWVQDLKVPALQPGPPGPGRRVRLTLEGYAGSQVHHCLHLPTNWEPGRKYPVIVEYAGNGGYTNELGDTCAGTVEGCTLGYGMGAGRDFLWLCLPCVDTTSGCNALTWWGDVAATVSYCKDAVAQVCQHYGGDEDALILTGFSRGAIACNYIGLHDDHIASLWAGFVAHSHYDGVRDWGYAGADRGAALQRLRRLGTRPVWHSHERSTQEAREYLASTGLGGHFTWVDLPFPNHTDAWVLYDVPERVFLREWLKGIVNFSFGPGNGNTQEYG